jgi:hypothetical protein
MQALGYVPVPADLDPSGTGVLDAYGNPVPVPVIKGLDTEHHLQIAGGRGRGRGCQPRTTTRSGRGANTASGRACADRSGRPSDLSRGCPRSLADGHFRLDPDFPDRVLQPHQELDQRHQDRRRVHADDSPDSAAAGFETSSKSFLTSSFVCAFGKTHCGHVCARRTNRSLGETSSRGVIRMRNRRGSRKKSRRCSQMRTSKPDRPKLQRRK